MKRKNSLIAIASSILLLASCDSIVVKDEKSNDQMVAMSFDVQSPSPVDSRATVSGNIKGVTSPSVIWEQEDKIKIFEKNHDDGGTFTLSSISPESENIARFDGWSYTGTEYYAVYPSTTDATYSSASNTLSFTIPSSQQAMKGTFDPRGAVQLGISKADGAIDASHVTAGLYITFTAGCNISAVTVQPADSKFILAGKVEAKPTNSDFVYTFTANGNNKVSLSNFPEEIAGTYILSALPSKENPAINLSITYYKSNGTRSTYTRHFDATSSWMAGRLYNLGTYSMSNDEIVAANTYTVKLTTGDNGTVIANPSRIEADHDVTLTITPEAGYKLGSLKVVNNSNDVEIETTRVDDETIKYKFTMPASNVTVTTTFVAQ